MSQFYIVFLKLKQQDTWKTHIPKTLSGNPVQITQYSCMRCIFLKKYQKYRNSIFI